MSLFCCILLTLFSLVTDATAPTNFHPTPDGRASRVWLTSIWRSGDFEVKQMPIVQKMIPDLTEQQVKSFWSHVSKSPHSKGCCEFIGEYTNGGYGRVHLTGGGRGRFMAHRISWKLHTGQNTELFVCHHCDNRKCVNPEHMFLGTNRDNIVDAVKKGRIPIANPLKRKPEWIACGEQIGSSLFTNEQILEMRSMYDSGVIQDKICKKFNTIASTVSRIVRRLSWKHLP